MGTNHSATSTSKGIVTNSYAAYYLSWICRNSSAREETTAISSLPQRKGSLYATCHIFNFCIFTDSYTTTLASIVIDYSTATYSNIACSSTRTIRILNSSVFTDSHVFRFRCTAASAVCYATTIASRVVYRTCNNPQTG